MEYIKEEVTDTELLDPAGTEIVPPPPSPVHRFWSWLLPPRRNRLVPWSGLELIVILLLTQFFWFNVVYSILQQADFFGSVYGPDFAQHMTQASGSPERNGADYRISMWLSVLCLPLNVATVVGVCALLSGTRPYQLGLTTHRFGTNVLAGIVGAVFVAPLHFLNSYLDVWYRHGLDVWYEHTVHAPPAQHPLLSVAQRELTVDRVMIVIAAAVAAPVMEELFFRGLLQPWFGRLRMRATLAVILAFVLALLRQRKELDASWSGGNWRDLGIALQPAIFVLLLAPGLLLIRRASRPDMAGGIYGVALLFAAAHSSVWPSPVPLFPLGLVLGWLAYRTNSLVGPIVLHSLFNLIACIEMFVLYFPTT